MINKGFFKTFSSRVPESPDEIMKKLEDIFTVQANIVGCPAISVPNGIHSNGLPIGLQIMGRDFEEGNLLNNG